MKSRIINVFYDENGYPFKDQERSVRFPIVGSGFMGASNTTQIKFYFKEIGDDAVKYVAVSKLPNGKVGSKVLENYFDTELDEPYALLELDSYYTQYKGDLFISLQGYQGGVQVTYNEDTELYEIEGTPTIQATGSIKFTNNYATQFVGSGEEQNVTLQQLLAIISNTVLRYYFAASNTLAEVFDEIGTKICVLNVEGDEYLCEMSGNTNIVLYDIHNQEWYAFTGANTTDIDSVLQDSNKQIIATKEDLENFGNLFTYKGAASVSEINALTNIGNGWCYNLTDSGTLTLGSLSVETGDNVAFNGTIWTKLSSETILGQYYTKQEGQEFEEEIDNRVDAIENQVQQVASGSPKGVYATLAALQAAYPTGTTGIYVVSADGHWYYWNGSAWTDGGLYLSSPETNTINSNFLSILYLRNQLIDDLFGEVIDNSTDGYYLSYSTGQQVINANYSISDFIPIEENVEYRFITPSSPFDLQVCFFDENKDFISGKLVHGNNVTFLNNVAGAKYLRFSYETIYRNATILTENTETVKEKLALCMEQLVENIDYDLLEGLVPGSTIYASGVYWGSKFKVNKGQTIKAVIINTSSTNSGYLYICRKNGNNYEILKSQAFSLLNVGENKVHLSSPYVSQYEELYLIISVAGLRYASSGSTIGMSEFFLDGGGTHFTIGTTFAQFGLGAKIETIYTLEAKVNNLTEPNSSYITVKKDGGDYSSLAQAINDANDGDTIIVYPGVYENEICDAQNKEIHIVGIDRNTCIIKNNTNTYLTPCLEICKGSVSNISFIQDKDLPSVITTDYPYAVHIDYDGLANNKLVFENCYFYSKFSAAVGVGLRANCQLEFNNCIFETEHNLNSRNVHIGALFVHPSTNANTPNQNILLNNCNLISKLGSALAFQYVGGSTSNVYATLLRNYLWSDETETTNVISYDGTGTNIEITDKSFGNNVEVN